MAMTMKKWWSYLILIPLINLPAFAQDREIALTIDDLPFVGINSNDNHESPGQNRFMKILHSLIDHQIPATGFVIAGSIGKKQWPLLEEFRKEGFALGNHTYSHANLNQLSAQKYINEISRADHILAPIMTQPKYFRYPYLAEGKGATKQRVQNYLAANQYLVAPVTIDSKDYLFNERLLHIPERFRDDAHLSKIKQQYLDYIWRQTQFAEQHHTKQILLVHANLLNSYFIGDVIQMYKNNGYRFISLNEALNNIEPSMVNSVETIIPASPVEESKEEVEDEWISQLEKVW